MLRSFDLYIEQMDYTKSNETLREMDLNYLLILLDQIDDADDLEKQLLESSLKQLTENILKLQYWELETGRDYKQWQAMVVESRNCIRELVESSLSLRKYMEKIYPKLYQDTVNLWQGKFYVPKDRTIELEQILGENYFG